MNHNICFVTNASFDRHATIKRAFGMCGPLTDLGHKVTICLEDSAANREMMAQLGGVSALWFRRGSLIDERNQKTRLVRAKMFDVIHVCGLGYRNALYRANDSRIVTVMDHVELESALTNAPLTRRMAQYLLEWWSLKHYSAHVVASDYLRTLWERRTASLRIHREVLYLPFAYEERLKEDLAFHRSRDGQAMFPGKRLLFYMGGFHKAYGCYDMLEAILRLRGTRKDFVAVLCGRGPEFTAVQEFVARHGLSDIVKTPGFVPQAELSRYLSAASVMISPLQDTVADRARCPSKLYEYMITDRPIVTCRIGENGRALGSSGFFYRPSDSDSLATALGKALSVDEAWRPSYRVEEHSWMARSRRYAAWLDGIRARSSEV